MRKATPAPTSLAKRKTAALRRRAVADGGADAAAAAEGLSPPQRSALERMAAGGTATAAAAAAGVSRQTVHRWLRDDPAFAAAHNAWQAAAVESARGRLLALADAAVDTVAAALAHGDAKTALVVLQRQGLLAPPTPGPTDPALVARQDRHRRARAAQAQFEADEACPPHLFAPDPPAPLPPDVPAFTEPFADPNDVDPNGFDANAFDLAQLDAAPFPLPPDLAGLLRPNPPR